MEGTRGNTKGGHGGPPLQSFHSLRVSNVQVASRSWYVKPRARRGEGNEIVDHQREPERCEDDVRSGSEGPSNANWLRRIDCDAPRKVSPSTRPRSVCSRSNPYATLS